VPSADHKLTPYEAAAILLAKTFDNCWGRLFKVLGLFLWDGRGKNWGKMDLLTLLSAYLKAQKDWLMFNRIKVAGFKLIAQTSCWWYIRGVSRSCCKSINSNTFLLVKIETFGDSALRLS